MENATNHQMAYKRAMTIRDSRTDQLAEALQTCLLSPSCCLTLSQPSTHSTFCLASRSLKCVFAYVEYAANLLRKHNLDACHSMLTPSTNLVNQLQHMPNRQSKRQSIPIRTPYRTIINVEEATARRTL